MMPRRFFGIHRLEAMNRALPPISSDQVLAFVELARLGNIRLAAESLRLSAEGFRSRLLTLEERLGTNLYEKERGRRTDVRLTHAGQIFLHKAIKFIDDTHELTHLFEPGQRLNMLQIVGSQYLTYFLLVDVVRGFSLKNPGTGVRVITRTEQQILAAMQDDPGIALGICAPTEFPTDLIYHPWFKLDWCFVAARGHPLLQQSHVTLADLTEEPLILFEPGSTGRQHVLEAFYQRSLRPQISMEATSTQVVLRMVEVGLGSAIVPLLASGAVTRGLDIGWVPLGDQIRPIENGILTRPDWKHDPTVQAFLDFILAYRP
jgi:DNA-binding transcriptional LysR family regulator